eukprot:1647758-Prymnesium_polylepis.1
MWAQDTYVKVVTIPIPEALFRLSQDELDYKNIKDDMTARHEAMIKWGNTDVYVIVVVKFL